MNTSMKERARELFEASNAQQKAWREVWKVRDSIPVEAGANTDLILAINRWLLSNKEVAQAVIELAEGCENDQRYMLSALCVAALDRKKAAP